MDAFVFRVLLYKVMASGKAYNKHAATMVSSRERALFFRLTDLRANMKRYLTEGQSSML